ncbi:hypothetical protein M514_01055 [Trichuris suis]|uniref:Uncharacterized protein n=1 Tax=Trichuris suis TaxID=68888 RepID=A0A085MM46_9BILA|nr:hypothetical protein M513_01055 [Trichuris suis]KFD70557.1 hypothetical protein M514_01055 [Trichuris suis]
MVDKLKQLRGKHCSCRQMVLMYRRVSIVEIMQDAKLSYGTCEIILSAHLQTSRSQRTSAAELLLSEKELLVEFSKQVLRFFQESDDIFFVVQCDW